MKQLWVCDHCKMKGVVDMTDHIDVYSGIYKIQDSHHKISPNCTNSNSKCIRIIKNPQLIDLIKCKNTDGK